MSHFTTQSLHSVLANYPGVSHYRVAFSGGLDSTVLLHAMAQLRKPDSEWTLSAVHVHHGLNAKADDWAHHCQAMCHQLDIPYQQFEVDASAKKGESPEEAARSVRYQVLTDLVQEDEILLTAHHQNDQAETLLLQLLRGGGVAGLAAMPEIMPFSCGQLLRPLLRVGRQALHQYAVEQGLTWVEDDSNQDTRFDRNYLRSEVMPLLRKRWSAMDRNLARTARHMADADSLLAEMARLDLRSVLTERPGCLQLDALLQLDESRQSNLLRHWLSSLGLAMPSEAHIKHVIRDVLHARADASPCVKWSGVEVHRYRGELYAFPALQELDSNTTTHWDLSTTLRLPGAGEWSVQQAEGHGLSASLLGQDNLTVRFRQGGERIRPAHRGHHHDLKSLFQEAGVPPWQRDRTPILYRDQQPIAVAGLCVSHEYHVADGDAGLELDWKADFLTLGH